MIYRCHKMSCRQGHPDQAKKRQWRVETHVIPQLLQDKPGVQQRVMLEMRKDKVRGTKDELRDTYQKRLRKAVECLSRRACRPRSLTD